MVVPSSSGASDILSQSLATQLAAYPGPVSRIEKLETHISWLFLAGGFAYKVKKPVDLGFVNFMTIERRRPFCDEERKLNLRLAPDLYLDVLAITGSVKHPQIRGTGTPIEDCARMRRFPQEL